MTDIKTNRSRIKCAMTNGFTLAEILITLGIIGVVAAITMPTLIQNYRSHVLKGQFKKAYSSMSQAVVFAKNDFGIANFNKYCIEYTPSTEDSEASYHNKAECVDVIMKQFKTTGKRCSYDKNKVFNYNKSQNNAYVDIGATAYPRYLLSDGMCVDVRINAHTLGLSVDINGNKKGLNALGHDIFSFWVNSNDTLAPIKATGFLNDEEYQDKLDKCEVGTSCFASVEQNGKPCTKNSGQAGNGLGCSWFAVNDICPDDETKGYWECLPR